MNKVNQIFEDLNAMFDMYHSWDRMPAHDIDLQKRAMIASDLKEKEIKDYIKRVLVTSQIKHWVDEK